MAKRKTHDGYYVTARIGSGGADMQTAYLVGPFTGKRGRTAALKMVSAASYAARHHTDDPRFQFAGFGTAKLTLPIDRPLPPGRLDLATVVDDVWIGYMINGGRGRSWDDVFSDCERVESGWKAR